MAGVSRAWMKLWPVAVLGVAAPAVPIAFNLANPPPALPARGEGYPIRLELPPASPRWSGRAVPAVEFDLADAGGSVVEVRKTVRINGTDAGRATIRVGADPILAISADDLRALLARAGRGELAGQIGPRGGAGHFIGFEEMRAQGIDVRYDVAADRIAIVA